VSGEKRSLVEVVAECTLWMSLVQEIKGDCSIWRRSNWSLERRGVSGHLICELDDKVDVEQERRQENRGEGVHMGDPVDSDRGGGITGRDAG
jgi:hypothetical protein